MARNTWNLNNGIIREEKVMERYWQEEMDFADSEASRFIQTMEDYDLSLSVEGGY
jgi:hypothetical protein